MLKFKNKERERESDCWNYCSHDLKNLLGDEQTMTGHNAVWLESKYIEYCYNYGCWVLCLGLIKNI